MNSLEDPSVVETLDRLHAQAEAQMPELRERVAGLRQGGERQGGEMPADWAVQLREFFLPVSREQGRFLYQTVRGTRAERVVEFGSSFGISSIYLAAGLRDNGGGHLIGSELLEDKAAAARDNIESAGLASVAEIRVGDARETLSDPGGLIDVVLLDGGPAMYVEIARLLQPHLRAGAVVLADNIEGGGEADQPYAAWVRDPANGFVSSSIIMKGGTEYSVWVGTAH